MRRKQNTPQCNKSNFKLEERKNDFNTLGHMDNGHNQCNGRPKLKNSFFLKVEPYRIFKVTWLFLDLGVLKTALFAIKIILTFDISANCNPILIYV